MRFNYLLAASAYAKNLNITLNLKEGKMGKVVKKSKEISHEEIEDAMSRFLKKGGVINKIEYNDNGFLLSNDLALDDSFTEASDSVINQLNMDFEPETRL